MNGTTFDHGKAVQDAEQILSIASRVEALFGETDAEIQKVQQYWQTTTAAQSADNAVTLYNSYKANFVGFLSKIKEKANEIYRSSETYTNVESAANKAVDAGYQINEQ